ncbi:MAG: hypothetical protein ACT4OF_01370, partial [Caulobacteraceae bacterium]
DRFGELVAAARDSALDQFERLLSGAAKAPSLQALSAKLDAFDAEQHQVIREAVRDAVDCAFHDLLFTLHSDDRVSLVFTDVDLKETSDGLHGDYVSEFGWVGRFSKHPL